MSPAPPGVASERGQAIVEFALVLPLLLLLVFGVAELSTAHSEALTIAASTREGARVAGALVNGGGQLGCGGGQSPNASSVDPRIIAAVERVLTASGTQIQLLDVGEIRVYKSMSNGQEPPGQASVWTYQLNGGPVIDGQQLDFVQQGNGWPACSRRNVTPADSAGVLVRYTYRARTPLGLLLPGLVTILITDRTVMPLNASR